MYVFNLDSSLATSGSTDTSVSTTVTEGDTIGLTTASSLLEGSASIAFSSAAAGMISTSSFFSSIAAGLIPTSSTASTSTTFSSSVAAGTISTSSSATFSTFFLGDPVRLFCVVLRVCENWFDGNFRSWRGWHMFCAQFHRSNGFLSYRGRHFKASFN